MMERLKLLKEVGGEVRAKTARSRKYLPGKHEFFEKYLGVAAHT